MEELSMNETTRRGFLAVGGCGLALAGIGGIAPDAIHAESKAVEKANEELVLRMCANIDPKNPTSMAEYLADDIVFQLIDGQPLVKGKEKFIAFVSTFFSPFERAEFVIHRSHAIGNLVINERTDNFFAKEGGQDQSFHVSGFCLVKDGKIKEWKDYGLPE
ncbi:MAG TPA: hypothetical protein EYN96_06435 [Candidatus Hydrogenedentes bacterium]|nr:hypothetical protein [Candidatus Hydrogenedentota bacterium]